MRGKHPEGRMERKGSKSKKRTASRRFLSSLLAVATAMTLIPVSGLTANAAETLRYDGEDFTVTASGNFADDEKLDVSEEKDKETLKSYADNVEKALEKGEKLSSDRYYTFGIIAPAEKRTQSEADKSPADNEVQEENSAAGNTDLSATEGKADGEVSEKNADQTDSQSSDKNTDTDVDSKSYDKNTDTDADPQLSVKNTDTDADSRLSDKNTGTDADPQLSVKNTDTDPDTTQETVTKDLPSNTEITIHFNDGIEVGDNASVQIASINNDKTEFLDKEKIKTETKDGELEEVSFKTSEASVYGVVVVAEAAADEQGQADQTTGDKSDAEAVEDESIKTDDGEDEQSEAVQGQLGTEITGNNSSSLNDQQEPYKFNEDTANTEQTDPFGVKNTTTETGDFNIIWSLFSTERAAYRVHIVDKNGNTISISDLGDVTVNGSMSISFADKAPAVDGYEYQDAKLDSREGKTVTKVQFSTSDNTKLAVGYYNGDESVDESMVDLTDSSAEETRDVYFVYKKQSSSVAGSDEKELSDGTKVALSWGEDAGLAEGTQGLAELIIKDSSDHKNYEEKALTYLQGIAGDDVEIRDSRFFEIHLEKNGEEVQPENPVDVKISLADLFEGENITVLHFTNDDSIEAVNAKTSTSEVFFKADSFSVYGIVGTDTYRRTYEFYKSDKTTPYTFQDEDGNTVSSQKVKNGETLQDPGIPSEEQTGGSVVFLGWYTVDGDEKVDITQPVSGITADGETVRLYAKFGQYTVTYSNFPLKKWPYNTEKPLTAGLCA